MRAVLRLMHALPFGQIEHVLVAGVATREVDLADAHDAHAVKPFEFRFGQRGGRIDVIDFLAFDLEEERNLGIEVERRYRAARTDQDRGFQTDDALAAETAA